MFVAKFSQTTSDVFASDKNGNMPFIGNVLAGTAKASIINGTIFLRDGLKTDAMYACETVEEEYEGTIQLRVQVLERISALDYPDYRTKLGAGKLDRVAVEAGSVDNEA